MRLLVCFVVGAMLLGGSERLQGNAVRGFFGKNLQRITSKMHGFVRPQAGKAAGWQNLTAGLLMGAIVCTTGCGSKLVLDEKHRDTAGVTAVASFATVVTVGVLAANGQVSPAVAHIATGFYLANFIFWTSSVEFDYGEDGHYRPAGDVDWYGFKSNLYSGELVYGIRTEGQQQYEAHKHELTRTDYNDVLVHFRRDNRDYVATLQKPRKFRYFRRYPRGLHVRIRHPSKKSPPPKPSMYFESLQPREGSLRVRLDEILGVHIINPAEYKHGDWVVVAEEGILLYGKFLQAFTSEYAQIVVTAYREEGRLVELKEDEIYYPVLPLKRLQKEE